MRSRRPLCVPLLLGAAFCGLAAAPVGATTLYRWVDEHGVTHYSDRPEPGAQRIQVNSAQSFRGAPAAPPAVAAQPRAATSETYARVAIVAPEDGAVISGTGGKVTLSADVEPGLGTGHQLWFILDGLRLEGLSPTDTSTTVDLPRGTHAVSVSITDATGRELIASSPVSFTVRQASIAAPPRGPALQGTPRSHP
jgi:hypothetical protein